MSVSETGTEHPDARSAGHDGSPDEEELADPTVSDEELDGDAEQEQADQHNLGSAANDKLIGVDEARERSGGDTADDAESTTEHDRAEGYS